MWKEPLLGSCSADGSEERGPVCWVLVGCAAVVPPRGKGLRTHGCQLGLWGAGLLTLARQWALSFAQRGEGEANGWLSVGPSQGRGRGLLRGMGWDPSHSTLQAVLKLGSVFQGSRRDPRGHYHFPSASRGRAAEAGGGRAGHGQGSSTEKGGSKAQCGICFSHLLAKGPREADWPLEHKARTFQ